MPRLVIRVNSKQPIEPNELQPTREIIEYHWHRILAVVLVGVLLAGGLTWLTYRWLSEPSEVASAPVPASNIFLQDSDALPQVELPQAESSHLAGSAPTQAPQSPESTSKPSSSADEASVAAKATTPEATTDAPAPEDAQDSTAQANVTLHSKHVKRAQLTSNVVNRAPVDQLSSVIPMNDQGLLRIYLFTETSGLQDRDLFHYWYRDGKQMARVRMPTSQRPIISSSSKFIDRYMTGQWEVKVIDDRNNLLATARFTVTP